VTVGERTVHAAVFREIPHLAFRAMGCQMHVWLDTGDPGLGRRHLRTAKRWMDTVEARLSRFRSGSELSRFNGAAGRFVHVSSVMWDVLVTAVAAAQSTGGLYDPTVLDALESAGYDRTFTAVIDDGRALPGPAPASGVLGWRGIEIDEAERRARLPRGVRVDLSAVGKSWAAERAAILLGRTGPSLVDAGGDIVARGAPHGYPGWPIGVADPRHPDSDLALLALKDHAVVTSGIDYRRWRRGGIVQHHIIDPRTRRPARTDLLSVTIVAANAAQANVHALVTLVLGAARGRVYLDRQPGVAALLVRDDGSIWTSGGLKLYLWPGTHIVGAKADA
jgi:thiamine biosynthesis lipoprotein